MAGEIKYLTHREIDLKKWDDCIYHAPNGLVYALSVYLDAMAPEWDALVLNDYEAVFPLPHRRKFSLNYIFHPTLIAQLGVFGNNITRGLLTAFIDAIPRKFVYVDLPLNFRNNYPDKRLFLRKNFVLPVNKDYGSMYDGYNKNVKRNILKATRQECTVEKNISIKKVTALALNHIKDQKGLTTFEFLFETFRTQGFGVTYGVSSADGELLASAAFLFSHKRAYYILAGNNEKAKAAGASHFLIDSFIKDHSEKDLLLDFEGSDAEGVANFYASFGAQDQPYSALKWNRLGWMVKWLKK
jgi:hypothetical protein